MKLFKVSVITPCLNAGATISETVNSVSFQDYPWIEHIIIDGHSSDKTLSVLKELSHLEFKLISEPDNGLYDAINKGIELSSGDLVIILNADDFFITNRSISRLVSFYEKNTDVDLVVGSVEMVSSADPAKVVRRYGSTFHPFLLFLGYMPPHPACLITRKSYDAIGFYNIDFSIAADFEFFVRFFLVKKLKFASVPFATTRMRLGGVSSSGFSSYLVITSQIDKSLRSLGFFSFWPIIFLRFVLKLRQYF